METFKKIDAQNVERTTTEEVDTKTTFHIPDIENKLQQAKDEVTRLEELLIKVKAAK